MKILIVEPSATIRRTIRNPLERAGISEFIEVRSGPEALQTLEQHEPYIIITNSELQGMSGTSLTSLLRSRDKFKLTPIVMISERSMDEDVLEAMDSGVSDYILIPFNEDLIVQKVQRALETAKTIEGQVRRRKLGYNRKVHVTLGES